MRLFESKRSLVPIAALIAVGVFAWPASAQAGDDKADKPKPSTETKVEAKTQKVEAKAEAKIDKIEKKAEGTKVEPAKPGEPAAKPGETPSSVNAKSADPDKRAAERAQRRNAQREAQREQLKRDLKAPMSEAMRQELRRHAQRVARIERIKALAVEQKDKDIAERAEKLLAKENDRHEKWMDKAKTGAGAEPAMVPPGAQAAQPAQPAQPAAAGTNAKAEVKGGAR